jgi:hypothetical protein
MSRAMKFLCLAYEDEAALHALSAEEWDALRRETLAYVEDLRTRGALVLTHALQSVRTAATVRVRAGSTLVTDGPYAETKEMIGGFFLIDAADLAEATALAARWPSARIGAIEVRPIEETLPLDRRYRPAP